MPKIVNIKFHSLSKGFSLIELIIIIVLIGIFATIALTRTSTGMNTIREQIAIDQITNDIDFWDNSYNSHWQDFSIKEKRYLFQNSFIKN